MAKPDWKTEHLEFRDRDGHEEDWLRITTETGNVVIIPDYGYFDRPDSYFRHADLARGYRPPVED